MTRPSVSRIAATAALSSGWRSSDHRAADGGAGIQKLHSKWRLMPAEKLTDIVDSLSPEEQTAVREFVEFLRQRSSQQDSAFRSAIDEFMDQHPELPRRLAQ